MITLKRYTVVKKGALTLIPTFRIWMILKEAFMGKMRRLPAVVVVCLLIVTGGCATVPSKSPALKTSRHERIVAVGDVHGSYDGLVSILRETAIIDSNNSWIGGSALLVQTGDLLDRGADIRPVLDLMMSLQHQAQTAGGDVVVLLGNHEVMNMVGDMQYVNPDVYGSFTEPGSEGVREEAFEKWRIFFGASTSAEGEDTEARRKKWMTTHPLGFVEYTHAMGPEGHYGKWLRRRPAMFRYGGTIFLHGGISPGYAKFSESVINQTINTDIDEFDRNKSFLIKKGFAEQFFSISEMIAIVDGIMTAARTEKPPASIVDDLPQYKAFKSFLDGLYEHSSLMIDEGPLWFRGFDQWPDERLITYLPEWLKNNNAWRVIVSHTPRRDGKIQSRLDGGIFLIDTGMLSEFYKGGRASALEIKDDDVSAVYGTGERFAFPPPMIDYGPSHIWTGQDGTPLPFETADEIEKFLMTAVPVFSEVITTGVNRPRKVLLEKDGRELRAIFRHESEIDDRQSMVGSDKKLHAFRDSFRGEIAAYEMNRLLGLDNMPPTVLRIIDGKQGTLQLWAENTMPDRQRAQANELPPEALPWNRQMDDMRVFDNLINNLDRNQTNILIDENWRLILIDHTRAFSGDRSLPHPERVIHCSRGLWHALRHLDEAEARRRLSPYLTPAEIDALFIRGKLLVQHIMDLINRNGEENVLR